MKTARWIMQLQGVCITVILEGLSFTNCVAILALDFHT
jgi:hypothetical protein